MRIIHTSDWHLGQNFYTKSRAAEHKAFLDWLLVTAEQHQVDAIIVAGDIFDTGTPPSYARQLYNRFVVALQRTGCRLVVLAGNHDSVATLEESRELLACLNTTVIACASSNPEDQVFVLPGRDGAAGAILCAIPFLRPRDVMKSQAGQSGQEKQRSLLQAISTHYQQCWQAALALREQHASPLPIIATGHLTTVGVTRSDAVRDIYIGTLEAFPAQHFPAADYIALGHIHRAQCVAKTNHIRYSGSPLPLSFDELGKEKSVWLVDFANGKLTDIAALTIPLFQPMAMVKGSLNEIEQILRSYQNHSGSLPVWLDIEINTAEYLADIQRHIQQLTQSLPVEVLLLRRSREQRLQTIQRQHKETLNELTVEEVFERRLALDPDSQARAQRVRTLFAETLSSVHDKASS